MTDQQTVATVLAAVGLDATLPGIEFRPSRVQLFRFGAVTWNAHRIHYDEAYARSEGHDGVVVHSTLRGRHLLCVVQRWLDDRGELTTFGWRNLAPAYADQLVVCRGRAVAYEVDYDGSTVVTIALEELDVKGRQGATGTATVRLRSAGEGATDGG
jgi:hydroxyacyl-ACP dehydratase HTD2-like protein with hotdog domain